MGSVSRSGRHWEAVSPALGFALDNDSLPVRREQLRMRMETYPVLVLSQLLVQPLFVWLLWRETLATGLLLWLASSFALHAVELAKWARHRHRLHSLADCRDWHLHFTFFALASGLLWGMAAVWFFPPDLITEGLMICVLLGLLAGSISMNPVHPPSAVAYALGILVPLVLRVWSAHGASQQVLAGLLLVFGLVILLAERILSRNFLHSILQQFEIRELLQQVEVQKLVSDAAKARLERINAEMRVHEGKLERMVRERTALLSQRSREVELTRDAAILALTTLAKTRDNETGSHILRTQNFMRLLAQVLQKHPRFRDFLSNDNVELLYKLAPLHDVGKVGIPDHILHKPGKLNSEEFEVMKSHAILGGNAISAAERELSLNNHFLRVARQIAVGHHEKWDGSGYPYGLRGEDIPIPARLMALADVYDALTSARVYKPALPHPQVVDIIARERGAHFDPDVVEAFLQVKDQFAAIAERFRDPLQAAAI